MTRTTMFTLVGVLGGCSTSLLESEGCEAESSPSPAPQVLLLGTEETDIARDVVVLGDGGLYVVGESRGAWPEKAAAGGSDVVLARLDASLSLAWLQTLGSSGDDESRGLVLQPSGVAVLGNVGSALPGAESKGDQDYFVAQYDADGRAGWLRQAGTSTYDSAMGLAVAEDGQLWVVGYINPYQQLRAEMFMQPFDPSSGTAGATTTLGGSSDEVALSIASAGGRLYVAGSTNGSFAATAQGSFDVLAYACSAQGKVQWKVQHGTSDGEGSEDIVVGSDGRVYLLATSYSDLETGAVENDGLRDAFLMSYETDGTLRWKKRLTRTQGGDTVANALTISPNNLLYITGFTTGALLEGAARGKRDLFVLSAATSDGTVRWVEQHGGLENDEGNALVLDEHGHVLVAGMTEGTFLGQSSKGLADMLVMRLPLPPQDL